MPIAWQMVAFVAVTVAGLAPVVWLWATGEVPETVGVGHSPGGAARLLLNGFRLLAVVGPVYAATLSAVFAWNSLQPGQSRGGPVPPRMGPALAAVSLAVLFVGLALWTIRGSTFRSVATRLIISWLLVAWIGTGVVVLFPPYL